ncbi:MAG: hypothetical protein FXF47_03265 [Candidatus Mcinerneyibacterium aminivorans]|jgi:hypothetical protein|uniref:Uncharacterized protein n=1 Tax=Candidatus Mcinerneyibacterium aminivorans TaxID=2703815 RepID=A0A5D0MJL8_9BACT|nr:MAG: hypothetical protein FXF47_03265 [Candidatus Mcinerneyibacterium aminivorans]
MLRKNWKLKKNPYYVLALTLIVIVGIFLVDRLSNKNLRLKPHYPFQNYENVKKITLIINNHQYIIDDAKVISKLQNLKCFLTDKKLTIDNKNKIIINNDTFYIGLSRGLFDISIFKHNNKIFSCSENILKIMEVQKQIENQKENN